MNFPKVAVVILNWNGKKFLEQFLKNVVEHSSFPWAEVVVADNASTDDSVRFLKAHFPTVKVIELEQNTGYAGGYVNALKQIEADYFVLLNSDVEVTQGWLLPVVSMMEQNKKIAAVQPKILDFNHRHLFEYAGAAGGAIDRLGYPFCRGRIFDTIEADTGQYDKAAQIFWASGACLFVSAAAYRKAGGLDADFFAHQEEIDLCWRLQRLGFEVWSCPQSVVYHVGGGTLAYSNPRKTFLNFRNNLWLLTKNLPARHLMLVLPVRLVLDGVAALQLTIKHQSLKDLTAILKAHFSFYSSIPSLLAKRKAFPAKFEVPHTVHRNSILLSYFLFKQKTFTQL